MAPAVPPGCPLTQGQYATLWRIARGQSQAQIAALKGHSQQAVAHTCRRARIALGATTTTSAVLLLVETGWLDPGDLRWSRITPAQAAYLRAFDELLRARTREQVQTARTTMDRHLAAIYGEKGRFVPRFVDRVRRQRQAHGPKDELDDGLLKNVERMAA
jgi:DNA-binding CsgD family transcriptional regulator